MAYVTYAVYVNEFKGSIVSADNFDYFAERASDFLDLITFNRLKNKDYSEYMKVIQNCCCALAEIIYRYEQSGNSDGIASETIGSYSVKYAEESEKKHSAKMISTARQYLAHTGLMYRGFDE